MTREIYRCVNKCFWPSHHFDRHQDGNLSGLNATTICLNTLSVVLQLAPCLLPSHCITRATVKQLHSCPAFGADCLRKEVRLQLKWRYDPADVLRGVITVCQSLHNNPSVPDGVLARLKWSNTVYISRGNGVVRSVSYVP